MSNRLCSILNQGVDDKPEMSPNLAELGKKDSENQSGEERKLRKSFSRLFCSIFKAFTTKSFIIILISFGNYLPHKRYSLSFFFSIVYNNKIKLYFHVRPKVS